jgi:hypothetical protein
MGEEQAALEMLTAFASVGAKRFDLTLTDAAGRKVSFRSGQTLDQLRLALPDILTAATRQQHNVIVRPRPGEAALVQLDDLGESAVGRLRPVSFLILCTSPGSYQAWLAVADGDAGFARRLRRGTGADLGASGASRLSGSLNFKEKYAPAFPRVKTVHAIPGLVVTRSALEALGIVAPAEPPVPVLPPPCFFFLSPELAKLPALPGQRASGPRRRPPRCQPGGFYLVLDRPGLGIQHRGNRRPIAPGKLQGHRQRRSLRPAHSQRRGGSACPPAVEGAVRAGVQEPLEYPFALASANQIA